MFEYAAAYELTEQETRASAKIHNHIGSANLRGIQDFFHQAVGRQDAAVRV